MKDKDTQKLKEEFYQFRMERIIDELKKEVRKYNKKNIFGNTFASCFKRKRRRKNDLE